MLSPAEKPSSPLRTLGRLTLGANLLGAGIGHLTALRQQFQAQVSPWVPRANGAHVQI